MVTAAEIQANVLRVRRGLVRRLWPGPFPTAAPPAEPAPAPEPARPDREPPWFLLREADVAGAYRLLLYRDPTPEELELHLSHSRTNLEYDVYNFVDQILASPERTAAIESLMAPKQGHLDGMIFHYRPYDTALGVFADYYGAYEPDVANAIEELLPKGGTFIDVGANIGLHTIRAARAVGPTGRVRAFEPNPLNVEVLHLTMAANGFDHVTIRPVAVSNVEGELPLHARRGQSNGTIEQSAVRWDSDIQVDVPCVRLDDELGDLDRLDLLKIDIEGAEPLAFAGIAETLKRHKPHILMEVFPDALRRTAEVEPADFLKMVQGFGYQLLPIVPGEGPPTTVHSIEAIVEMPATYKVTHVDVLAEPID